MPFVSRGGDKLGHALAHFALNVRGALGADFGCNAGGFTDCLLQAGAARVYALDTGYGALAWTLRRDPRVVVMERTNALHASPPEAVDVVAIDMAWTPQRHAVPAALRWLRPGGRIVTLIKPHYELGSDEKRLLKRGVLDEEDAARVVARVVAEMPALGARVIGVTESPVRGGATKGNTRGNSEWLALLESPRADRAGA